MRKILLLGAALASALGAAAFLATAALAADPAETPFPSPTVGDVFIAAQTVTADGTMSNYFTPGSTVAFRAYAVDGKTHKVLQGKDVKYFYVKIPNQPNVKLKWDPKNPAASSRLQWVGTWSVPASYAPGLVDFKVLVKNTAKRQGQFVQFPVTSAQLTISSSPPPLLTPAPAASTLPTTSAPLNVSIYVDTVNGTTPASGVAKRLIGCTQTNVFKRGEQLVVRSWAVDMASGDVLSSANVDTATATVPGAAPLTLNWGAHGATTNRVWFWSSPWVIPADYPLGDTTINVAYKTDDGKSGIYPYKVTIIP
jgi:hypothetical protein